MKGDYAIRLGDELEVAINRSLRKEHRRNRAGLAIALGFALVVAVTLPLLLFRSTPDATVVAYEQVPVPTASLPTTWGRVPHSVLFEGDERLSLVQVSARGGGMLAVGADSRDGNPVPVVLRSSQIETWIVDQLGIPPSATIDGVAIGDGSHVVVGSDADGRVAIWYRTVPRIGTGQWQRASIERTAAQVQTALHRAEAFGEGFAAFGTSQSGDRAAAAIALSQDGSTWRILTDPVFVGATAEATGGTVADGMLFVSGIWSDSAGESNAVVWRGSEDWTRIVLDSATSQAAATALASRDSTVVAVGFDGSAGSVWWSPDGTSWNRVASDDFVPERGSIRIYDVIATSEGFVAAGAHIVGTDFERMTWTSPDGVTWTQLDLADTTELGGSVAFGLAADDGVVVAVGADVGDEQSYGAIWVSPSPSDFVPSSPPVTEDIKGSVPRIEAVNPSRASADTEVVVRVESDELQEVPVLVDGAVACTATGSGKRKSCAFTPGSLGLSVGSHNVSVGSDSSESLLEVVPPGTPILTIDAVYQPNTWPLVFAVFVRNHGSVPVNIEGWSVTDRGGDTYVVRDVTIVPPGRSLTISQEGREGDPCPPDTGLSRHMCNYLNDAVIGPSNRVWSGSDMTLLDPEGNKIDVWSR